MCFMFFFQRYSPNADDLDYGTTNYDSSRQYGDNSLDAEPLSYNSRPRMKNDYIRLVEGWQKHKKVLILNGNKLALSSAFWRNSLL